MSANPMSDSSAGEKRCSTCGAVAPSIDAVACWMCGERFLAAFNEETHGRPNGRSPAPAHANTTNDSQAWAWWTFGGLALMLVVALASNAPGLLIPLAVLLVPAIFSYLLSGREKSAAKASESDSGHAGGPAGQTKQTVPSPGPTTGATILQAILLTFGMLGFAALVGLAAFGAFVVICIYQITHMRF